MSLLGQSAPDFALFSDRTRPFNLAEHEGTAVLLLFFPAAFTGVCTTELNTVSNDLEAYSGALVLGVSTDTPMTLAEFKKVNGFKFDLLSDHNAEVCKSYNSKYDHNFTAMKLDRIARRSAFVIDRSGIVVYEEVLENAGDIPNLDAIKSKLAEIA